MLTLKLFNCVPAASGEVDGWYIDIEKGIVIDPQGAWAKDIILKYYSKARLNNAELNKTFHKSWNKIKNSSRKALLKDQILHYISTYGSNFQAEVYIPPEKLDLPIDSGMKFILVHGITRIQLIEKINGIIESGIALQEEKINDIIQLCADIDYKPDLNKVKNKELKMILMSSLADFNVPPEEFVRFLVFAKTGSTLLIKDHKTLQEIRESSTKVGPFLKLYSHVELAKVFNRFKPIFIELKKSERATSSIINKISRLSKTFHVPLKQNPLNMVTQTELKKEDILWLDKAPPFALFRATNACVLLLEGKRDNFYKIRNGKSWATTKDAITEERKKIILANFNFLRNYIRSRFQHLYGKTVYIPRGIEIGLPTSEKMMIGNIPFGTKFSGKNLVVGVYWRNEWGARDIDVSGISKSGKKVGWDGQYYSASLLYSGDMTNAENGAVEYLYGENKISEPFLLFANVYSGDDESKYKIIIGEYTDKLSRNYMMDSKNLLAEVECTTKGKETLLGALMPSERGSVFIVMNTGTGKRAVSTFKKEGAIVMNNLLFEAEHSLTLNKLLKNILHCDIVHKKPIDESVIDLSFDNGENKFLKLFDC